MNASEEPMARKAAQDLRELTEIPDEVPASGVKERDTSRKLQLAEVLEHQGRIELDLDQERLARLRSSR